MTSSTTPPPAPQPPDHSANRSTDHSTDHSDHKAACKAVKAFRDKIKTAALGLLLLWIGFAWLADISWAFGLIGVGVILIVEQVVRRQFGLGADMFWGGAGAVVIAGAALLLMGVQIPVGPIILIAVGLAFLTTVFSDRSSS